MKGLSPRLAGFYRALFEIQSAAQRRLAPAEPKIDAEAANLRLKDGLPLLSFDDLPIDWEELQSLITRVAALFTEHQDIIGELPHNLQARAPQDPVAREVIQAWYEKKALPLTLLPADSEEELAWEAIIHAAVKPFLANSAAPLRRLVNQDSWRRAYCPICGGVPDFSFLDRENGARRLLCSRCDSEWLFQRLQCPFCSNEDQGFLAYFTDDRGLYRLYVCDRCHRYIKAIDMRAAPSGSDPMVERLLTPHLDREASEKGYRPGWADLAILEP